MSPSSSIVDLCSAGLRVGAVHEEAFVVARGFDAVVAALVAADDDALVEGVADVVAFAALLRAEKAPTAADALLLAVTSATLPRVQGLGVREGLARDGVSVDDSARLRQALGQVGQERVLPSAPTPPKDGQARGGLLAQATLRSGKT